MRFWNRPSNQPGMFANLSSMVVSYKDLEPSVDPVDEPARPSSTADTTTIPMIFGMIGVALTLATTAIGIMQIKIAVKHRESTTNCRDDLETAIELSSPSPDLTTFTSS